MSSKRPEREVYYLFLYQTEATLLSSLVTGIVLAASLLLGDIGSCEGELLTSAFCTVVTVLSLVALITVSAIQRGNVSQYHKSVGQANIGAVFFALVLYATYNITNTICSTILLAGHLIILCVPMLILGFSCTPILEIPPLICTREAFFLTATMLGVTAPGHDTLADRMLLGVIVPTGVVALMSVLSSGLIAMKTTHWLDIIPQGITAIVISTYLALAVLQIAPFDKLEDVMWYVVVGLYAFALFLCGTFVIAHIIRIGRQKTDDDKQQRGTETPEPIPEEAPVPATSNTDQALMNAPKYNPDAVPVINLKQIVMPGKTNSYQKKAL